MKISNYINFINESVTSDTELIEDCLLEFCDEYDQDISVQKGYLALNNGEFAGFLTPKLKKMAMSMVRTGVKSGKEYIIKFIDCYKLEFVRKSTRQIGNVDDIKLEDQSNRWSENMNDDLDRAIDRISKMSNRLSNMATNIETTGGIFPDQYVSKHHMMITRYIRINK